MGRRFESKIDVARRSIDAYNRRDFEGWWAECDPAVEVDWSDSRGPDAGIYRGREEIFGFIKTWFELFEQITIEPERFIELDERVLIPNRSVLRGRDGIETQASSCLVDEFRDGRISRIRLFQDLSQAIGTLGRHGDRAG